MDAEYAYHCWEDDSILPEGQVHHYPKPASCMFVELRMCNKLKKLANNNAGRDDAVIELVSKRIPFCFNHISFLNSEKMRPFVSVFLSLLCLQDNVKDSIIDEMFRFARSMLDDDENAGLEVLPFVVDVAVTNCKCLERVKMMQFPGLGTSCKNFSPDATTRTATSNLVLFGLKFATSYLILFSHGIKFVILDLII